MRKMSIEDTLKANGGAKKTYWKCKICGYKRKSKANVMYHVFEKHELPYLALALAILALV